jgi:hypothetical protein
MERLSGAILLKAIEDWNDPENRPEIEEFLQSDWFETLTEILDIEAEGIRRRLHEDRYQRIKTRAAYR